MHSNHKSQWLQLSMTGLERWALAEGGDLDEDSSRDHVDIRRPHTADTDTRLAAERAGPQRSRQSLLASYLCRGGQYYISRSLAEIEIWLLSNDTTLELQKVLSVR